MKNILKNLLAILVIAGVSFSACKKQFDEPFPDDLPNIVATHTIAQLLDSLSIGQYKPISSDMIIQGVVIGDDESGNIYKDLIIQDATAGIDIRIDLSGFYTKYPVGRKLWVKCKGLYIGDYNGKPQLAGSSAGDAIAAALLPNMIIAGPLDQFVTPAVRTISQLTFADVNTLVEIDSVEFRSKGATFADAVNKVSVNLDVFDDCNNSMNGTLLRSSGYANFASTVVPSGRGKMIAIVGVFGSTYQLTIRDLNDLDLNGPSCGGIIPGGLMTIRELRNSYSGATASLPVGSKIRGIVISDYVHGNMNSKNMVVQDATGGIVVRYTGNHTFPVNSDVEIDMSGASLEEYSNLMQVNGADIAGTNVLGTGSVTPLVRTVQGALDDAEFYESCLFRIDNATIAQGTFAGNKALTDATATVSVYTYTSADFDTYSTPSGTISVTAIMSEFTSGKQLLLRDTSDVDGGTIVPGPCSGTPTTADIIDVRDEYAGTTISFPNNWKITGTVVSDLNCANIDPKNMAIQDATGGILVRFTAAHSYAVGTVVEVNTCGLQLTDYSTGTSGNGLLELNNVDPAACTAVGTATPTPVVVTVAQILANPDMYESKLVTINNANFGAASIIASGTMTLSDATGSVPFYTRTQAICSIIGTACNGNRNVTCVVSAFSGAPQVSVRTATDIQ